MLMSVDPPGLFATSEQWRKFVDEMDAMLAAGHMDARPWRDWGRRHLSTKTSSSEARMKVSTLMEYDEALHPRDERGRWTESGGGDGGAQPLELERKPFHEGGLPRRGYHEAGQSPSGDRSGSRPDVVVPVGLGVPEGSVLARSGISTIKYEDAEKVTQEIAKATGADIRDMHRLIGGWTDPSTNTYYPEPTLVAEFKGKPEDIRLTAEAIAHVLGPQKEIWVVSDGEKLPNAHDLRLDVMPSGEATAQQLSDIARKVDPELFSGFTQTVDDHGRVGISLLVKDGIAPWKSEPTTATLKNYSGGPLPVYINPSARDIKGIIENTDSKAVRVLVDRDNNLYVWDGYTVIHATVEKELNLDAVHQDIWALYEGKVISERYWDERGGEHQDPKERLTAATNEVQSWLDQVQSTPHGAAAISAKADVGLLHLVEALGKAGVDAEVLPTAVVIDKRAGNEQGYSASIEREAGLGAVSALNAYRTGVAHAIQAGRPIPAFKADLTRGARVQRRRVDRVAARMEYDEALHPRDERGRWTESGGAGESVTVEHLVRTETGARESVSAATTEKQSLGVAPLPGSVGHPNLVATRVMSTVEAVRGGEQRYLQPSLAAMQEATGHTRSTGPNKTVFEYNIGALNDRLVYPNMRPQDLKGDAKTVARNFINHLKDNLRFVYERSVDAAVSKFWYDGARVIVDQRARAYGYDESSIAGMYAALSPQMDWDQNVHHGDRLLQIYTHEQNTRWNDDMSKTADRIWSEQRLKTIEAGDLRHKTLAECKTSVEKALWVRTFNETYSSRHYRQVLPTGQLAGLARNKPKKLGELGELSIARPPAVPAIAGAIACLEAKGDRAKISAALGWNHKVRSFYNNILDPHSPNGDVTSDTHNVGAGLLRDLGGQHYAVHHNFGTGPEVKEQKSFAEEAKTLARETGIKELADLGAFRGLAKSAENGSVGLYGLYAQALRELARELKLEPRQLQSITWVTKRNHFDGLTDRQSRDIEIAWQRYYDGEKSLTETQKAVWRISE